MNVFMCGCMYVITMFMYVHTFVSAYMFVSSYVVITSTRPLAPCNISSHLEFTICRILCKQISDYLVFVPNGRTQSAFLLMKHSRVHPLSSQYGGFGEHNQLGIFGMISEKCYSK